MDNTIPEYLQLHECMNPKIRYLFKGIPKLTEIGLQLHTNSMRKNWFPCWIISNDQNLILQLLFFCKLHKTYIPSVALIASEASSPLR